MHSLGELHPKFVLYGGSISWSCEQELIGCSILLLSSYFSLLQHIYWTVATRFLRRLAPPVVVVVASPSFAGPFVRLSSSVTVDATSIAYR